MNIKNYEFIKFNKNTEVYNEYNKNYQNNYSNTIKNNNLNYLNTLNERKRAKFSNSIDILFKSDRNYPNKNNFTPRNNITNNNKEELLKEIKELEESNRSYENKIDLLEEKILKIKYKCLNQNNNFSDMFKKESKNLFGNIRFFEKKVFNKKRYLN